MIHLRIFIFAMMMASCAQLQSVDRSLIYHPGMDLTQRQTSGPKAFVSKIDASESGSKGGTCTTCAY